MKSGSATHARTLHLSLCVRLVLRCSRFHGAQPGDVPQCALPHAEPSSRHASGLRLSPGRLRGQVRRGRLMAVFDGKDGVISACHCPLEIMDNTRHTRGRDGAATLPLGIGLNSGPVLIGNIGSEEHLDYSAIGETVNLPARMCGSTRPVSIVISETVVAVASGDARLNFFRSSNCHRTRHPGACFNMLPRAWERDISTNCATELREQAVRSPRRVIR